MTFKLPPLIAKELEPIRGRWSILPGGKHLKLIVDGHCVGIFPRGSNIKLDPSRQVLNVRSAIRRHLAGRT